MITAQACVLCNGTGWVAEQAGFQARPCFCQKDQRKQQRIASAAIPTRYLKCRLENFHDRSDPRLKRARQRMREFVDCWPGADRGFLLMGGCGVGKTHLAVAALLEIIDLDKPGQLLFSNFQDLIQAIHGSFSSDLAPSKSEILEPLLAADLLVLDELGSQKLTDFVKDILYYVINTRYNNEKTTFFTTNYTDEPTDRDKELLDQRIGIPLRSRLHQMTNTIVIDSSVDDYRKSAEPHI